MYNINTVISDFIDAAMNNGIALEDGNDNAVISAKNIADVKTAAINTINVYDILKYNTVIATKAAVAKIEEVYA